MKKIKVVISALIFPFTMMHFFWRAFERRDDVELFVVGPFFDDYIPWNNGMVLPKKYVKQPHFMFPRTAPFVQGEFFNTILPWKPDLFIMIDAGWHPLTKPDAGTVIHIQTDPHVLKQSYEVPAAYSDIVYSMQNFYRKPDEKFLPYGWDSGIHYPEEQIKRYDACLIGLHYPHRDALVARLRGRGLGVYYSIGEVYDDYRRLYNESKIALCWSSLQDLPARFWEGLAMKLPVVANRVPDQDLFFENGKHYCGFNDLDEAEGQVMRLLTDDKYREEVAWNGYVAVQGHSYDQRVTQIMKDAGVI